MMKPISLIIIILFFTSNYLLSQMDLDQELTEIFCKYLMVPNDGKYKILTTTENSIKHQDQFIVAMKFELAIDNKIIEKFSLGSIGIGNTEEEALNTCIEEWGEYFFLPYKNYLLKKTDMYLDNNKIYYSQLGIRGDKPVGKILNEKERIKILYENVKKSSNLGNNSVNTVLIFLTVKGKNIEGECRINGKRSDTLTKLLVDSNFFVNANSLKYTLKQFLIIE